VTTVSAAHVITPHQTLSPGWVEYEGATITEVGSGTPEHADLTGHLLVPGFVDVHCHGGGGATFDSGDPEQAARAAAFHARHGTTTLVASLVSATPDDLDRQAAVLADLVDDGLIAGIHLEGPFLSPQRRGAHDPGLLRSPDPATVERLLGVGRGQLRMMTIAPELEGGLAAMSQVAAAGVVAAIGHTDATYDVACAAIEAGARVATHLFNGMRPLHHREPGPILALVDAPEVICELIMDGVHLHPSLVRHVAESTTAALVTDAMAAAGMNDGGYSLGGLEVSVSDGVARLADGGSIAGSTLTTEAAFRRAVHDAGLSLPAAVRLAATNPAALIGLTDRGSIAEGLRADLLLLDEGLSVRTVIKAGRR
jgi:N-acetylglucosamine-6-phosphate deacetylase